MSQTTPDVRPLCPHCRSDITWTKFQEEGEDPLYAGHCHYCGWELLDVSEPARELEPGEARLLPRIAELEAANAELMATLANERGEGEAPCEGWAWGQGGEIPDPCWHKGDAVAYMEKAFAPEPATPAHYWLWWVPGMPCCQRADTARAAIRAASSQGADVPKDQR